MKNAGQQRAKKTLKGAGRPLVWPAACAAVLLLAACAYYEGQPDNPDTPRVLNVSKPDQEGRIAPVYSAGDDFTAVWAGRFLDPEPARRAADRLQGRGLTAFVIKKTLTEVGLLSRDGQMGDFHLVMAGLFGRPEEAGVLGRRLAAEGLLGEFQTVEVDDPGEIGQGDAQVRETAQRAVKVRDSASQAVNKPLDPGAPAVTGEAFKKVVYGRYIGSFADLVAARKEAEILTRAGWPAAVEREQEGGQEWFRVYLSPTQDRRDWAADSNTLVKAKRQAASQPGIVILVDASSLAGQIGVMAPRDDRFDASACAGFSEAGRLTTTLERTIAYIPEIFYLAALATVDYSPISGVDDAVKKAKGWWRGENASTASAAVYGPAIYNRPEMEAALSRLTTSPNPAALSSGFKKIGRALSAIPGEKILLVFSEFQNADGDQDIKGAFAALKSSHSGLRTFFIYGDTDDRGYALAGELGREGGGGAWDGCLLLRDNAYFEKFIKTIFR